MFESSMQPRIYGLPPGANFPALVARGLRDRMSAHPPEAMARVEVIVNTGRMQAQLRAALIAHGDGFLPRIRLIDDLGRAAPSAPSTLRDRLILARAVRALLKREADMAPQSAAFSLAESLFRLFDEMLCEGVAPQALEGLDVSNHSLHWDRSLRFIRLLALNLGPISGGQGRLRRAVQARIADWQARPPTHPVLIAGSTGSRGATALLMQAVARLPQGALILPGFDPDLPGAIWQGLNDALQHEDHPQYRFSRLLQGLGAKAADVAPWLDVPAPDPRRNALVSLALRPAPVTDQWLHDGPALGDMITATQGLSLIEAKSPRDEANAIALAMRQAVVNGEKAALITPDRVLARRVTAALDRWRLRPDDSAGRPLALSAPGRFLRHCAAILAGETTSEGLIALLKHPIAHSAGARGPHLRHLRELELYLRRRMIPFPDAAAIDAWAAADPQRRDWADWLAAALAPAQARGEWPLEDWVRTHRTLAEALAGGTAMPGSGELWLADAGVAMQALMTDLAEQAPAGGDLALGEYQAMFETLLAGKDVRESVASHPLLKIWGTLEARAQGGDLIILAGLNEGVWPAAPTPDPWFNRQMRHAAGLLLPERQIGLSAHDFQQAIGAPRVILSRALRNADAETVPSRWLNRLTNLVAGLTSQNGPAAIEAMRARGGHWVTLARDFDADTHGVPPEAALRNPRPAPSPPVATRPRELPVTRIEALVRNPYEVYARHVLGLKPLDPLTTEADARLRGTILHKVLDEYVRQFPPGSPGDITAFLAITETILRQECPWRAVRMHWMARLHRSAPALVEWNADLGTLPVLAEEKGHLVLTDPPFTLTGQPDRIDRDADGRLTLYDYKTGALPTTQQQLHFNKQLILLAIMAEDGAFGGLPAAPVAAAAYVGVGTSFKLQPAPVAPPDLAAHRAQLRDLLRAYLQPSQGYTAMRAVKEEARIGDYDALARRGEWEPTDAAQTLIVGDPHG